EAARKGPRGRICAMVHVFLHEQAIAGNTGNAIRLSAVTGAHLHLIEPLGFDLEDAKLRRAGLDYHDLADVRIHADLDQALSALPDSRVFAFTARTDVSFESIEYEPEDVLLFGTEPTGLPDAVLDHPRLTARVRIPMLPARRSLNLARAGSIAACEPGRHRGDDEAGAERGDAPRGTSGATPCRHGSSGATRCSSGGGRC